MIRMPGALAPMAVAGLELAELVGLAVDLAGTPGLWRPRVRHGHGKRWYVPLPVGVHAEAWLLGWPPGERIELHDHGGSSGAFCVVKGRLVETFVRSRPSSGRATIACTSAVSGTDGSPVSAPITSTT